MTAVKARRTGLLIQRREGQEILIGDDIMIRVHEVRGANVRISVVAPADIRISRAEVASQHGHHYVEPADNAEAGC